MIRDRPRGFAFPSIFDHPQSALVAGGRILYIVVYGIEGFSRAICIGVSIIGFLAAQAEAGLPPIDSLRPACSLPAKPAPIGLP